MQTIKHNVLYKRLGLSVAIAAASMSAMAATTITKEITLESWISAENAITTYSRDANNTSLVISSDENCDIDNWQACADGQQTTFPFSFVDHQTTDTATRIGQTGYYNFSLGTSEDKTSLSVRSNGFERKTLIGVANFNDKLWLFGGSTPMSLYSLDYSNRIWSSDDGENWVPVQSDAPFDPAWINSDTITTHNGELWIYHRSFGSECIASLWKSEDAISWEYVEHDALLDDCRSALNLVSFQGKLLAIGAFGNPKIVYSSIDGSTWVQETYIPDITNWTGFLAETQDTNSDGVADKLWLVGNVEDTLEVEVLHTSDMVTWEKIDAATTGLNSLQDFAVFENQLVVSTYSTDGISYHTSLDGQNWVTADTTPSVSARFNYTLKGFKGNLYSVGGTEVQYNETGENPGFKDDFVLRSSDLVTWDNVYGQTEYAPAVAGYETFSAPLAGSFLIGGIREDGDQLSSVWQTDDGINWTKQEQLETSEFTPRSFPQVALYGTDFVMTGGVDIEDDGPVVLKSTFITANDWQSVPTTNLTEAQFHQMEVFGGRLLIVGGYTSITTSDHSGVLTSTDGEFWSDAGSNVSFSGLTGHQLIEFNGALWLAGGVYDDDTANTTVWYSTDGVNWQAALENAPFGSRIYFDLTEIDGSLVLSGGSPSTSRTSMKDTWVSQDGFNWVLSASELPQEMSGHMTIDTDQGPIFTGGYDLGNRIMNQTLAKLSLNDDGDAVWRLYGNSSATLEITEHVIEAFDAESGELINTRTVYQGLDLTIALASEGETVESVETDCNGSLDGNVYRIESVMADCQITVSFEPELFTVSASSTGNGSISPATSMVEAGDVVTLSLSPRSWWYVVDSVSGCGGELSGLTYTTAPVVADCSVEASFEPVWRRWFR